MRPYFIAGSILVVMMAFQNCGRATDMVGLQAGVDSTPMTKMKADQFGSLVVTDVEKQRALDVDLASGQISGQDERGIATGEHYCLGEEDRRQLIELLTSAEVCEPIHNVAPGQQCAMLYQYPYARLRNASQEVNLGEKNHGCDIPVDLCGAKGAELKRLTDSLLARIDHLSCQ